MCFDGANVVVGNGHQSDINSESTAVADSEDTKIDSMDKIDAETQDNSYEVNTFGFDDDREMLGMRTENTKTYLDDQGRCRW